jgi:Fur family ferric uptake transcriptional regulator
MNYADTGTTRRRSHQREVILAELAKLRTHPTADELCQIVRRRLPRVSLATVYRNLEVLAEQGLIARLELSGQQWRFDGRKDPHSHIRCVTCGAVADLDLTPTPTPLPEVQRHTDYAVAGQHTEFAGLCPACRAAHDASLPEALA